LTAFQVRVGYLLRRLLLRACAARRAIPLSQASFVRKSEIVRHRGPHSVMMIEGLISSSGRIDPCPTESRKRCIFGSCPDILNLGGLIAMPRYVSVGKSKIWIGSIVVDCSDFPRMMAFLQDALHDVPREPAEEGSVVLKDPEGQGPNLSLNRTPEGPLEDYRVHLDLYTAEPEKEVERLLRLGATLKRPAEEGKDFVTLADPGGKLFDASTRKDGISASALRE